MNRKPLIAIVLVLALGFLAWESLFVVHQTQQALVLQLGQPLDKVYRPGLHIKLPFIQNVLYFDSRILDYDARPENVNTIDQKVIVLDSYARWRIVDPLLFYRTVRTIPRAQARLNEAIASELGGQVGRHTLTEIVTTERSAIMDLVTVDVSKRAQEYGIEVVDVRIRRTDLPVENQNAIFGRMQAERERQARQYRSEGEEESTKIRSNADKERALILADANRESQIIRGQGDAEAAAIFAAAFSQSPEFFEFQRGLEALRKSLKDNTRIILTPDSPVLQPLQ